MCSMAKSKYAQQAAMQPKPVHPRALIHHGLFGLPYIRNHLTIDHRWTVNSLKQEFKGMTELLERRRAFTTLENRAQRKSKLQKYHHLKTECRDGRQKLNRLLIGDNQKKMRHTLINHKDLQRLYQRMPLDMAAENINQRTFVLRKERDRLLQKLDKVKETYNQKLVRRANLENQIQLEKDKLLKDEVKANQYFKKIENSKTRLIAIKTINTAYKRLIQLLHHDEIYFDPILRSLALDIEDQQLFIKNILFLGKPAIKKFDQLSEEYRVLEHNARKTMTAKMQWSTQSKENQSRASKVLRATRLDFNNPKLSSRRYVRETESMLFLKNELNAIEGIIKQVKFATLCSNASEIYPRLKQQEESNFQLRKTIEKDNLAHRALVIKTTRADAMHDVLLNNLSPEEINRIKRVRELQRMLVKEEEFEKATVEQIKNRSDAYVLLRYSLWNLDNILRHVEAHKKTPSRRHYPNAYLKLPLLKFEMFAMRACPPDTYEENIDILMLNIKTKIKKLMKMYDAKTSNQEILKHVEEFHRIYMENINIDDDSDSEEIHKSDPEDDDDVFLEAKMLATVPNRKQIKAQSAKLVEEFSKRDE